MANTVAIHVDAAPGSGQMQSYIQLNATIAALLYTSYGSANFAINSNFDVKNSNDVQVVLAGKSKQLDASTNFDTGTTAIITADKWGIAVLSWDGTTATVTWASTGTTHMAYASEAAAIAALGTGTLVAASGFAPLGYVTVLTGSGVTFTAGTDALAGGTGGTPATTTNYYNDPSLNGTTGAALLKQLTTSTGTVISTDAP